MKMKLTLALILAAMLAACNSLHCQEQSENSHARGGCGLQSTF